MAVVALSSSGTSFTATSPLVTVYEARASIIGSTSTNSIYDPVCNNTMNSTGGITLGSGNTLTFGKINTVSEDIIIHMLGA
jgi:hypothetical protein